MWESGFFTETKLTSWEQKLKEDRGWPEVKTYLEQLYHDHKQYSRATAKKALFADSAYNIKEAVKKIQEGLRHPQMMQQWYSK